MTTLKVTWVGNPTLRPILQGSAIAKIAKSTSENKEPAEVFVFVGESSNCGRRAFQYDGRLFLGDFCGSFVVVIEDVVLDIHELIFMFDSPIFSYIDLLFPVNLADYL